MKNNLLVPIIIAVVIGGAGGFFGGMKYEQSKLTSSMATGLDNGFGRGQQGGRNGGRFGSGANRPVSGDIISSDSQSVTVKLADGSSKIILLSDKTTIGKMAAGRAADLKTGTKIAAFGTNNSDGSITASNIQINPAFGGGGGKAPNTSVKSPDAKEYIIEGSNYKFSPDTLTLKKGEKARIIFKNSGGTHDFRVDELNISTAVVRDGQEDFVEFTPDKSGTFEYYCSVANHRAMGMVGKLTVE